MSLPFLVAVLAAATVPQAGAVHTPVAPAPGEIAHAIDAGRLEQAQFMIARSIAAGSTGPILERLIADVDFASGRNLEALARYQQLLADGGNDAGVAERAGIAALRMGKIDLAKALIDKAIDANNAGWRAWNARGVIADLRADWVTADESYARALLLGPGRPEVANNIGWSQLLRGQWKAAAESFERAGKLDPGSTRIANNRDLARSAIAADLPTRRAGESGRAWAERLNDAGMAAFLIGDSERAKSAFTRALDVSETWYDRAAANMESMAAAR